ncbi:MAG: SIR2 family protein [Cyanobacteriota bacterium]|nr:SIR2 family protein [Cyanobacteriota bacterium]
MDRGQQQKHLIDVAIQILIAQYESNNEFNTDFDQLGLVSIGKYQYEASKVLFWTDQQAYNIEKKAWEDYSVEQRNAEAIKLLKDNDQTVPFKAIVEAVKRQRVIPFIGAGLSKPMGMPQWGEALKKLHLRMAINNNIIDKLIDSGDFLEAAELLFLHDTDVCNNFINTTYNVQKIIGSILLLPSIFKGCVVTTNFDKAIEQSYDLAGISFDGYMHGTQEHNFFVRLVKGDRCILKLHGDAEDSGTFVFTRSQYQDAYGSPLNFSNSLPQALRQIYLSSSLIFIGCSLEQDWTLDLFRNIRDAGGFKTPNHYAFLSEPDAYSQQTKQQKESRLLSLGIQPIWYPSKKHEYVEKLLQLVIDIAENRISCPS